MTFVLDPSWEAALRTIAGWAVPIWLIAIGVYFVVNAKEIRSTWLFSDRGALGQRAMGVILVAAGLGTLFLVICNSGLIFNCST